ncbi:hypothetical protein DPMN_011645 [Dreissena polymorpha]|uniref:Uncharacterized protein n=1 Tax=Dreissena polymorpha TaxID=45954 RepID=A0A9D4S2P7_DREPO|nr:hypothetical protein DPMN_011645 [Dreissena polymorpha]
MVDSRSYCLDDNINEDRCGPILLDVEKDKDVFENDLLDEVHELQALKPVFDVNGGGSELRTANNMSKRSVHIPVVKRIHTCAFMRRLGLPIGYCLGSARERPVVETLSRRPVSDAYEYLRRHWPVNTMLGGSVGRK